MATSARAYFKLLHRRLLKTRQKTLSTIGLRNSLVVLSLVISALPFGSVMAQENDPIPVFAYYYIWFDTKSWDRAKIDYPILGRYSSDDAEVMLQHIKWAKAAGIDGFIVSWKSTDKLNPRLDQLVELASKEGFKLAIIYESLDFARDPLPVEKVRTDLDYFIARYAGHTVFDLYQKPVIIWSGIWKYSVEDVQSVTQDRREHLLILASEKNVEGYQRVASLVDGDAYYWSSVNPETHPGYVEKLKDMGETVHANGGIWVAPAAPGYDARLVGGTTVVERNDGQTLKNEMKAAYRSSPDAIGIISWNEFSENSHIEPSQSYGKYYLDILADIIHVTEPVVYNFDSSEPVNTQDDLTGNAYRVAALGFLAVLIISSLWVVIRRDNRATPKD